MKYFVYFHSTLLNSDPNHRISSEPVNSNLFHIISLPNRKYIFVIHFRFAQRLKIGYFLAHNMPCINYLHCHLGLMNELCKN